MGSGYDAGSIFVTVDLDSDKFDKALAKLQNKIKTVSQTADKSITATASTASAAARAVESASNINLKPLSRSLKQLDDAVSGDLYKSLNKLKRGLEPFTDKTFVKSIDKAAPAFKNLAKPLATVAAAAKEFKSSTTGLVTSLNKAPALFNSMAVSLDAMALAATNATTAFTAMQGVTAPLVQNIAALTASAKAYPKAMAATINSTTRAQQKATQAFKTSSATVTGSLTMVSGLYGGIIDQIKASSLAYGDFVLSILAGNTAIKTQLASLSKLHAATRQLRLPNISQPQVAGYLPAPSDELAPVMRELIAETTLQTKATKGFSKTLNESVVHLGRLVSEEPKRITGRPAFRLEDPGARSQRLLSGMYGRMGQAQQSVPTPGSMAARFAIPQRFFTNIKTFGRQAGAVFANMGEQIAIFQRRTGTLSQQLANLHPPAIVMIAWAALGAAVVKTTGQFVEFKSALNSVGTVSNLTKAQLAMLGKELRRWDASLGTTTDLLKGTYEAFSAGARNATEALQISQEAAKFATGQLTSTRAAVDAITTNMNVFGVTAQHAADVMAAVVRYGKTTGERVAMNFGKMASTAQQAGFRIEEVGAAFAEITTKGLKADLAATAINAILRKTITPTKELRIELQKLGYDSGFELAQQEGLLGTLEVLQEIIGTADDAYLNIQRLFQDEEAVRGFAAIKSGDLAGMRYRTEMLENSEGSNQRAYEIMRDGIKYVRSEFVKLAQTIGQTLMPAYETLGDKLKKINDHFVDNPSSVHKMTGAFKALGIASAALALKSGILLKGLKLLLSLFTSAGAGGLLGAITGWGGLAAAAFVGIREALNASKKEARELVTELGEINTELGQIGNKGKSPSINENRVARGKIAGNLSRELSSTGRGTTNQKLADYSHISNLRSIAPFIPKRRDTASVSPFRPSTPATRSEPTPVATGAYSFTESFGADMLKQAYSMFKSGQASINKEGDAVLPKYFSGENFLKGSASKYRGWQTGEREFDAKEEIGRRDYISKRISVLDPKALEDYTKVLIAMQDQLTPELLKASSLQNIMAKTGSVRPSGDDADLVRQDLTVLTNFARNREGGETAVTKGIGGSSDAQGEKLYKNIAALLSLTVDKSAGAAAPSPGKGGTRSGGTNETSKVAEPLTILDVQAETNFTSRKNMLQQRKSSGTISDDNFQKASELGLEIEKGKLILAEARDTLYEGISKEGQALIKEQFQAFRDAVASGNQRAIDKATEVLNNQAASLDGADATALTNKMSFIETTRQSNAVNEGKFQELTAMPGKGGSGDTTSPVQQLPLQAQAQIAAAPRIAEARVLKDEGEISQRSLNTASAGMVDVEQIKLQISSIIAGLKEGLSDADLAAVGGSIDAYAGAAQSGDAGEIASAEAGLNTGAVGLSGGAQDNIKNALKEINTLTDERKRKEDEVTNAVKTQSQKISEAVSTAKDMVGMAGQVVSGFQNAAAAIQAAGDSVRENQWIRERDALDTEFEQFQEKYYKEAEIIKDQYRDREIRDWKLKKLAEKKTKEQKVLDDKKKALEKKQKAEKNAAAKQAFETNKLFQLAQLAVTTPQATLAAFTNFANYIPGPAAALAAIALVVPFAAIQAGAILGTQFVPAAAQGGVVTSAGNIQINEQGGEIRKLATGDTVIPHDLSSKLLREQAGSGPQKVVNLDITFNIHAVDTEVISNEVLDKVTEAIEGAA